MKPLDRLLQDWRIAKARPYIGPGSRVLDVGCADGRLFRRLGSRIREGVGIDPDLGRSVVEGSCRLIAGNFPKDLDETSPFDVITMLAVVEHIPADQLTHVANACARWLKPGGVLVVTVPSPSVDRILHVLQGLRVIDGMSVHEHHGFDVEGIPSLFSGVGMSLVRRMSFQLGLNNLFVFRKGPASRSTI